MHEPVFYPKTTTTTTTRFVFPFIQVAIDGNSPSDVQISQMVKTTCGVGISVPWT